MKKESDKKYLEWLSYQPSCLDGAFNQYIDGVGRNIACHVRRASNAGTGYKPPFSAVPMTDEQHKLQSFMGEYTVLKKYGFDLNPREAKEWFDNQAKIHLEKWKCTVTKPA